MSEKACRYPCLLFALNREAAPFLRGVQRKKAIAGAPAPALLCGDEGRQLVVVETGVGAQAVQSCFAWLLGQPVIEGASYSPERILLAGFSGALTEDLEVGDIVLGSAVIDPTGQEWPLTWPDASWPAHLRRGRLFCSNRFIGDTSEKLELGRTHQAVAVDMESAVFARLCKERQIACGCLRVISDDVRVPLAPAIFELIEGESVSYRRLAWLLVRSPGMIGQLLRLARQTQLAAQRLAEQLHLLLDAHFFSKKSSADTNE